MRFKAHYISQLAPLHKGEKRLDYWRIVDADSLNEATTLAKRYTRKRYMLGAVIEDKDYNL